MTQENDQLPITAVKHGQQDDPPVYIKITPITQIFSTQIQSGSALAPILYTDKPFPYKKNQAYRSMKKNYLKPREHPASFGETCGQYVEFSTVVGFLDRDYRYIIPYDAGLISISYQLTNPTAWLMEPGGLMPHSLGPYPETDQPNSSYISIWSI